jgi:hypothetical protein
LDGERRPRSQPHGLEPFCRVVGELLAGKDQGVNPVEPVFFAGNVIGGVMNNEHVQSPKDSA